MREGAREGYKVLAVLPSPAPSRLRRAGLAVALSLVSLLVSLGLAELFLRSFAPVDYRAPVVVRQGDNWRRQVHRASAVPGLSYELVPDLDRPSARGRVRTNAHGMRDRERTPTKPAGTVRIAVVGDSFTFGFGVDGDEAYPAVLERLLNPAVGPRRFEVLNFGVGGYSSRDEAVVVREKVVAFGPDLLLVGYVLNDPEIDPVQPLHAAFARPAWWQHWHLLRLLARAVDSRRVADLGGGNYTRALHKDARKWGSVEGAFTAMAATARDHGFATAVAIFPLMPARNWKAYPYADLHAQVRAMAEARGFLVIDLLAAWSGVEPREIWVSAQDRHPNARGHELAARAVYQSLIAAFPRLLAAGPEGDVTRSSDGH